MRNHFLAVLLLAVMPSLAVVGPGCTDPIKNQDVTDNRNYKVTVWSGGFAIKTYMSTGAVLTKLGTDGWYFVDKETEKTVQVMGTVTIEEQ